MLYFTLPGKGKGNNKIVLFLRSIIIIYTMYRIPSI